MTAEKKILLDEFRGSSRSDMLDVLIGYEWERRTTTCDERRESLEELVELLWPEYLSS